MNCCLSCTRTLLTIANDAPVGMRAVQIPKNSRLRLMPPGAAIGSTMGGEDSREVGFHRSIRHSRTQFEAATPRNAVFLYRTRIMRSSILLAAALLAGSMPA